MFELDYDTRRIAKKIGFKVHTVDIYNRGSNIGGDLNYKGAILNGKRLSIIHEYILIFKKP
jgi:hypothetical protein